MAKDVFEILKSNFKKNRTKMWESHYKRTLIQSKEWMESSVKRELLIQAVFIIKLSIKNISFENDYARLPVCG